MRVSAAAIPTAALMSKLIHCVMRIVRPIIIIHIFILLLRNKWPAGASCVWREEPFLNVAFGLDHAPDMENDHDFEKYSL